jgi:hypothetical protein
LLSGEQMSNFIDELWDGRKVITMASSNSDAFLAQSSVWERVLCTDLHLLKRLKHGLIG